MATFDQLIEQDAPKLTKKVNETAAQASSLDSRVSAVEQAQTGGGKALSWNVATNTPLLTADASGVPDGNFYDIIQGGAAPFAGANFAQGDTLNVGDRLKPQGSQWYRVRLEVGNESITTPKLAKNAVTPDKTSFAATQDNVLTKDIGFSFKDKGGNLGFYFWKPTSTWITNKMSMKLLTTQDMVASKVSLGSYDLSTESGQFQIKNGGSNLLSGRPDGTIAIQTLEIPVASNPDGLPLIQDEAGNRLVDIKGNALRIWNLIVSKLTIKLLKTDRLEMGGFVFAPDESTGDMIVSYGTSEVMRWSKNGAVKMKNLTLVSSSKEIYPMAFVDPNGNIGRAFNRDLEDVLSSKLKTQYSLLGQLAGVNHIIIGGQSLSIGGSSTPALSTTQKYNSLMFVGGVVTYKDQNADPAAIYASLVPLVESGQESPASGISEMLCQLLKDENGIDVSDNYKFLFSAPGLGNQTIAQLSKGTTNYAHLIADVTNGLRLANAQGKTYNVPAICWNQGEADASNANYGVALAQLQRDLNADIKAITGQLNDVKLISYQTASFNAYNESSVGKPIVAYAQFEAVMNPDYRNLYMSGPMYQYEYVSDNVHLQPESSKRNGATHAVALKRLMVDGIEYKPWQIKGKPTRQGKIIELRFGGGGMKYPLVFDTTNVPEAPNKGFRLFNSGGTELSIASVEIVRGDAVRITASADVPVNALLTYAANGTYTPAGGSNTGRTRGNLRDSQDIVLDPTGFNKHIYNWSPIQRVTLT